MAERLTYLVEEWQGEELSSDDRSILIGALPVLGEAYGDAAPPVFPDGSPTEAKGVIAQLSVAAVRSLVAAQDDETSWRLLMLMRYARQPQNVPVSVSWTDLIDASRRSLEANGDASDIAALDASANLNLTWWRQNGQWEEFESALVKANTSEEVAGVVIMPAGDASEPLDDDKSPVEPTTVAVATPASHGSSEQKTVTSDEVRTALRTARIALVVACAALLLGPVAGFAAAKVLEVPGPQGARGPQGPQGVAGERGPAGEGADLALEEIESIRQCVNDYMDIVGRSAGGAYRYFYC